VAGGGLVGAETIIMATSNPASISRFAEIGRQEIVREAQRERLALEAVEGRDREVAFREAEAEAVPAKGVRGAVRLRARGVVLGLLG